MSINNKPTCPPKTAVAYARYSSASQRDVSIEQQLRDIREYAAREGYTLIYEYADHAKSGFKKTERRVQFHAMLQAAEAGTFDTVIAWKVDRFGRNRRDSAVYKGQLADLGVRVRYAMEPIPDGAAGVLTEGMLEAIAEWYSRNLSENTKRGLRDNAMKCLTCGHNAYGYSRGPDDHFVINEEEAAVVRRIFTYYSQGYSVESVVRLLNKEGIKTKKGQEFQRSSILSILKNDAYIGMYHYAGITVPGGTPAIIDQDLWDACQLQRQKTGRHFEKSPEGYLLSGKVTCGLCGSKMYGAYGKNGHGGKRHYYYTCRGRKEGRCTVTPSNRRKAVVEGPIVDLLLNEIMKGERLENFIKTVVSALSASRESSPARQLEIERADVLRRIDNITRAISEGIWTKHTSSLLEELNAREEELQNQISYHQITDSIVFSEERIRFMMHKIAEAPKDNYDYLKVICNALVNSVTVYEHWMRVVINAVENVQTIPTDELPPLEQIPDLREFDFCSLSGPKLVTVDPYPVIVFKIAV